jgi:hypothetical protein
MPIYAGALTGRGPGDNGSTFAGLSRAQLLRIVVFPQRRGPVGPVLAHCITSARLARVFTAGWTRALVDFANLGFPIPAYAEAPQDPHFGSLAAWPSRVPRMPAISQCCTPIRLRLPAVRESWHGRADLGDYRNQGCERPLLATFETCLRSITMSVCRGRAEDVGTRPNRRE